MNNVVITGVGAVSVLGLDHESIAHSLYHSKSGLINDATRKEQGFRSILTGSLPEIDYAKYLTRKQAKSMPIFAKQAYIAAKQAILHANLDEEHIKSEDCGLIFSNDSCVEASFRLAQAKSQTQENSSLGSGHLFQVMNSTVTMNLGVLLGIRGGSWTLSAACAGGLLAVAQAVDAIRLGRQQIMICGGAQELNTEMVCAFDGLGAFSVCPHPELASRPFDKDRDGLVPSGGAGCVILESEEHAKKRGAKILSRVVGCGYSSDGQSLTVPSNHGLELAMKRALKDAQLSTQDITEINAHATSTPVGDRAEANNIHTLFGEAIPQVLPLKALTGHEFWMAGTGQIVYANIMAMKGFLAGTPSFAEGDECTRKLPVLRKTINESPKMMLCNASGFGGSNASVILNFTR